MNNLSHALEPSEQNYDCELIHDQVALRVVSLHLKIKNSQQRFNFLFFMLRGFFLQVDIIKKGRFFVLSLLSTPIYLQRIVLLRRQYF